MGRALLTPCATRVPRLVSMGSTRLPTLAQIQTRGYREYNSIDCMLSASEAWHALEPNRSECRMFERPHDAPLFRPGKSSMGLSMGLPLDELNLLRGARLPPAA